MKCNCIREYFICTLLYDLYYWGNGHCIINILNLFIRTVWYELLCGEWPFRHQPPETVIWQVGKGLKQSLGTIPATREFKVRFYVKCHLFYIYKFIIPCIKVKYVNA